ncbi:MAG: branched-chain amino acid ABC transporter permease [Deltaproteobacteria bacterium]|nr:branched-chain amino acid ABC transporter permease [Deltaproteobacteria bacterium]
MEMLLQGVLTGLAVGSIYGLSALGFVIIYKSTGILNVAQGGLVMLGSFLCYTFSVTIGLPFWLSFIATMAAAFLLGLIIDRLLFRPMIGQPLLGVVMMTIALLSVIDGMTTLIWSVNYYSYPEVFPETPIEFGDIILSHEYVWAIGICLFFFLLFGFFFRYTRIGLKMRAVSEDQQAAQAAGVGVKTVFSLSWAIGTAVGAVGGIILGLISMVYFGLSFIGLKALPVVILGGLESLPGAILGGLIIGVLENMAGIYLEPYMSGVKDVAPFVVLMIILLIKPHGLFGLKRIERV